VPLSIFFLIFFAFYSALSNGGALTGIGVDFNPLKGLDNTLAPDMSISCGPQLIKVLARIVWAKKRIVTG